MVTATFFSSASTFSDVSFSWDYQIEKFWFWFIHVESEKRLDVDNFHYSNLNLSKMLKKTKIVAEGKNRDSYDMI